MMRRRIVAGVGAVLCVSAAMPALAQGQQFPFDTVWVAESLGEQKFASVSRPTLRIARDGKVSGMGGCDSYMGSVASLEGGKLIFNALAMKRMGCFGAGGENEQRFSQAIGSTTQWRIERRMLVLETAQGPLRFRRR